ncbi:MAG: energy-coupled thiamine transporter ThiT [Pseudobutyrivibrio sp.]|nr:energy-coupled thiamine transporter ThiT [Pseudobutyrivibrio sp.]
MINHVSDSNTNKLKLTAKQLAFCAVSIALAFVLSNIKVFHFPTGGSVTLLSMLVACLPGFWFGPAIGIVTGVAYGLLNLIVDPYILFPAQVIVDYILAFGALGLSGFFSNAKHGLIKGYLLAIFGRYVFSVISGWIFFGEWAWEGWSPLTYSLAYNAIYIGAEAAVTIIILCLPPIQKVMNNLKDMATN